MTILTAQDIQKQGFSTVYDALSTLTQFTGEVQGEMQTNGFTPNANVLSLRSLGPGRVLVLLNGRRVADYPLPYNGQSNFANLSTIPAAAIDRIEVLTNGASAIYGSDAISGVINFITKKNYNGDTLRLRAGTTTMGGGSEGDVQWIGGKTGDNWNVTYSFEQFNRDQIFNRQREFMDSYLDNPDAAGRAPVSGLYLIDGFTGNHVDLTNGGATCAQFFGHFSVRTTGTGSRCAQYDYPAFSSFQNSRNNTSVFLAGDYTFKNGMQAFGTLNYYRTKSKYSSGLQFWGGTPEGYYYDPQFDTLLSVQRIFQVEETGQGALNNHMTENTWNVTAGLRGTVFNDRFDWEAAVSHSEYKTDNKFNRLIASKVTDYFLGPQLGLDPFFDAYPAYQMDLNRYTTPLTPEQFASISATLNPKAKSEATQATFTFSGDLFKMRGGAAGFASVLEFASQKYKLSPDPRTLPNADPDEAAYNFSDTGGGGKRNRSAIGVELRLPWTKSLTTTLAGRYDKYDDVTAVDGAFTWNAGIEFRPVKSLLLRGSYATSFRAPDMHYVFADESGFYTGIFDEYRCRADGNTYQQCTTIQSAENPRYGYTVAGTRQGNHDLQEETSKSWTVGFVWDISDNFSVNADYYHINVKNSVYDLTTAKILEVEANCRLGVDRGGNAVDPNSQQCQEMTALVDRINAPGTQLDEEISTIRSFPINSASEVTRGIDASLRYRLDTARFGRFMFGLNWTHVLDYKFSQYAADGYDPAYSRDSLKNFDARSSINASIGWTKRDWTVNLYGTRRGSAPNWAETGRIAPFMLYNLNVGFRVTDKARLTFYVNNILNNHHPRDDTMNTYPYFSDIYRQGAIGRQLAVQWEYKFN